jgi:hypothetical protein
MLLLLFSRIYAMHLIKLQSVENDQFLGVEGDHLILTAYKKAQWFRLKPMNDISYKIIETKDGKAITKPGFWSFRKTYSIEPDVMSDKQMFRLVFYEPNEFIFMKGDECLGFNTNKKFKAVDCNIEHTTRFRICYDKSCNEESKLKKKLDCLKGMLSRAGNPYGGNMGIGNGMGNGMGNIGGYPNGMGGMMNPYGPNSSWNNGMNEYPRKKKKRSKYRDDDDDEDGKDRDNSDEDENEEGDGVFNCSDYLKNMYGNKNHRDACPYPPPMGYPMGYPNGMGNGMGGMGNNGMNNGLNNGMGGMGNNNNNGDLVNLSNLANNLEKVADVLNKLCKSGIINNP